MDITGDLTSGHDPNGAIVEMHLTSTTRRLAALRGNPPTYGSSFDSYAFRERIYDRSGVYHFTITFLAKA